ncbi:hypothetical protein MBT84_45770 [Streptomyces sp. MBT84]|nr:hypothetical protein [Streptomyces sp. MBT84]
MASNQRGDTIVPVGRKQLENVNWARHLACDSVAHTPIIIAREYPEYVVRHGSIIGDPESHIRMACH